jgi:transcriptional regulator with XRE-family HTH domain
MAFELHEAMDWRRALREQRRARGFTQTRLAREANLSLSAVKQYESGQRKPSADALDAIIAALGLTAEQSTTIRAGAGFAPDMKRIFYERLGPYDLTDLEEQAEGYSWPVFVTNMAADVLVANRAFFRAIGPRLEHLFRTDPARRNFLSVGSEPQFAERVRNWDDSMRFFIGLMKGEPRWDHNLERPAPLLEQAYRRFLEGDPTYVRRTLMLYEGAPPVRHTTRIDYRVDWTMEDGREVTFKGLIHVADLYQELTWHDWLPADASTFELFPASTR